MSAFPAYVPEGNGFPTRDTVDPEPSDTATLVGVLGQLGLVGESPYAKARKDEIGERPNFSGKKEDYDL